MRRPEDDVFLSDGNGFLVGKDEYNEHLEISATEKTVRILLQLRAIAHEI